MKGHECELKKSKSTTTCFRLPLFQIQSFIKMPYGWQDPALFFACHGAKLAYKYLCPSEDSCLSFSTDYFSEYGKSQKDLYDECAAKYKIYDLMASPVALFRIQIRHQTGLWSARSCVLQTFDAGLKNGC